MLTRAWNVAPFAATAIVSVPSLAYLPVYALLRPGLLGAPLGVVLLQAAYQGVLNAVVALYLYGVAVRALGPARGSLVPPAVPVLTALLAVPVLGEVPTAAQWLGVALVFAGLVAAATRR